MGVLDSKLLASARHLIGVMHAWRSSREKREDFTMIRTISVAALGLWVAAGGIAVAADVDDKAMERKVRDISIAIGNAYACTEMEGRKVFKGEAHQLFDLILQDVGSDLAFIYASGLGYGSSLPKDKLDCPKLLKQWEEFREDYELKGDGG
jgi:hypothetical protein